MCVCLCNLGGSDGSLSESDEDEQELWEETQIGKGVKRRPGEQVREYIKCTVVVFSHFLRALSYLFLLCKSHIRHCVTVILSYWCQQFSPICCFFLCFRFDVLYFSLSFLLPFRAHLAVNPATTAAVVTGKRDEDKRRNQQGSGSQSFQLSLSQW